MNDQAQPAAAAPNNPGTPFTNYLRDTLLFGDALRNAVVAQGLTTIDDLLHYTDDNIQQVCKIITNPGGTVPNPLAAVRNQPPSIPNRGVEMGFIYQFRLRHLRYYRWHLHRVQRPWDAEQANLQRLTQMWERYELEDVAKDSQPDYPSPMTKVDDSKKVIEDIDNWLIRRLGACGAPLAYITRADVEPPALNEDPGFGLPTLKQELIRRTRHEGNHFEQDNVEVWEMIRHITHGGPGWNWVSRFAKTQDGREAYFAFKQHYLGESYAQRTIASADKTIENLYFDGKSRNFTFEQFSAKLNKAFDELEENGEGYTEARKVRKLTAAIRDPSLKAAKSTVLALDMYKYMTTPRHSTTSLLCMM